MVIAERALDALKLNAAYGFPIEARRGILEALDLDLWKASAESWAVAGGISIASAARLQEESRRFDAEREFKDAEALGARIVCSGGNDYPEILRSIPDAPLALYVQGSIGFADALAVVGSRHPTSYGLRMTSGLSEGAARAGLVVVSGLALGIDAEAHRSALRARGRTWAVLGSGLKHPYPKDNEALAREIVSRGGAVISELPLDSKPWPGFFPMRNRIVSGLSWGVLVVEGRARSGSLITARRAAEQGRPVFAVPGPVDSPLSQAPHALIVQGAKLVCAFADIAEDFPPECRARMDAGGFSGSGEAHRSAPMENAGDLNNLRAALSLLKRKILEFIGSESRGLEEIGCAVGLGTAEVSASLVELELAGLLVGAPGQRYAAKKKD